MLSLTSPAEAAPATRALTRTGTPLLRGAVASLDARSMEAAIGRPAATAVIYPRPRLAASPGSVLFADATNAVGQAVFAGQQPSKNASSQQHSSQKYAHTTRITTAGGGGVGPHPARDPV